MDQNSNTLQCPKERTIYATEVDVNAQDDSISKLFSHYGKIENIHKKKLENKVSLFVVFSEEASAQNALLDSGKLQIAGKPIRINRYIEMSQLQPEANILIEDLPLGYNDLSLSNELSKYGKILSAKVSYHDDKKNGVAYIQFETKEAAKKFLDDKEHSKFKAKKLGIQKGKKGGEQSEKTTIYIRSINSDASPQVLEQELKEHFSDIGVVESIKVQKNEKDLSGKCSAFLKFKRGEDADKAIKSEKPFKGQKLILNWFMVFKEQDIEASLFTKNLKASVTEEQLKQAYSEIADVQNVTIIKDKKIDPNAQKACIYLTSGEEGKKCISLALKVPNILALYNQGTVYISPFLKVQDRLEFLNVKQQQYMKLENRQQAPPFPYPVQYPVQQYPYPQPPPYAQQYQYPPYGQQQQFPPQFGPQRQFRQPYRGNYQGGRRNYQQYQGQQQYQRQPNNQQPNYQPKQQQQIYQRPQQSLLNLAELNEKSKDKNQHDDIQRTVGKILYPIVLSMVNNDNDTAELYTGILCDVENFTVYEMDKMIHDKALLEENIENIRSQQQASETS